ncbi:hypothetical protein [Changchengzhania lutea]|uniref:hypothetical protein n=1 Tax=Changchengzhania lutea TaxID=2049305 RepID=UPI00115F0F4D|nr:hypothetical protein [Changchengzhania lutea]
MNRLNFKYFLLILLMSLFYSSCTKEVDFNQVNDLELNPILESSLVFFDEPASQFVDNGIEVNTIQDFVIIDVFNEGFINDNLIKADFVFEYENSIHREFSLQVDFLDSADQIQHSFVLTADASPSNEVLKYQHIEVFDGDKLITFKQTTKLIFTLTMQPGQSINENSLGKISLRSKGVFYFNIKDPI